DRRALLDRTAEGGCPQVDPVSEWSQFFERLAHANRVVRARSGDRSYWIASERAKAFSAIFPDAIFESAPAEIAQSVLSADDAILAIVTGWMGHIGPVTAQALSDLLGVPAA